MCSACFPRLSLPTDASLSSTGSSEASSPASTVLSRHYDFLPPIPPRFVAFAWQYLGCTRRIRSSADECRRQGLELVNPVSPAGKSPRETTGAPKFLENLKIVRLHMFSRLRQDCLHQTIEAPQHGPWHRNSEGSHENGLSKLNSMAFGLAVYASQGWLPRPHARLASGRWSGATGRAFHPQGSNERFQSCFLHLIPLSQALLGTMPTNVCFADLRHIAADRPPDAPANQGFSQVVRASL